ncbi:hypothetical protein HNR46_003968 [Haloferula luteola]|uniref:LysM domain-containing protein n=1 Tax=Haloferula luteola TaxID=595692 RepID=A0A840V624_9BACT|nr:LysM peptidoglycan-binding domain-containing protein [Haloferula luteola]MBB5353707.1 hypothetical protein [Haloferula luteola]
MSLWTLIRILAGLVVAAVVVITLLVIHHVREEPLPGVLARWIPVAPTTAPVVALPKPSADSPEIDPGAKLFEKARQSLAVGDLTVARDRLNQISTQFPHSAVAPETRRILSEMNLDDLLDPAKTDNKILYKVRRGDSYLAIASRHDTSLDMIVYLNGLFGLGNLQPDDELLLMPLDFKLLVEPERRVVSLWKGDGFIAEFPAEEMVGLGSSRVTKIESKAGEKDGRRIPPSHANYRGATKVLTLSKPNAEITVAPEVAPSGDEGLAAGIYLKPEYLEELALLLRPGNEVEIRHSGR